MTIEDIKKMNKDMLTPRDICSVLGCDANTIRSQAEKDIKQLGFSATKLGSRVKIPRLAFIKWYEGERK